MLINRPRYVERALLFRDTDLIKVVTGIRRCGKSSLLDLIALRFLKDGIPQSNIVRLNLESKAVRIENEDDLYAYFKERLAPEGTTYIFIDEIQRVQGWENAVNAMRVDFNCDMYVTGSNAFVLSSNLSTYISGRYVEIGVLPLTFSEYLTFCGLECADSFEHPSLLLSSSHDPYLADDVLNRYLFLGGMPAIASLNTTQEQHAAYMKTLYESVMTRDVMSEEYSGFTRSYNNRELLDKLTMFMADNIGSYLSVNKIKGTLDEENQLASNKTIDAYIGALCAAYIFYPVHRYDIRGKALLRTQMKFYLADTGVRSWLFGYRRTDTGRVLENAVYLHLIAWGYSVRIGKLYNKEVDFIASKDGTIVYIQVAEEMISPETKEREVGPLLSIRDGFEKMIVVRYGDYESDIQGIKIIKAAEFLLSGSSA